jgi:hypothetical protein
MNQDDELKPCPLTQCGGEALLVFGAMGGAYVECQNCGLTTRNVQDDNSEAENARLVTSLWNTRSTPTPSEDIEGLVERPAADLSPKILLAKHLANSGWADIPIERDPTANPAVVATVQAALAAIEEALARVRELDHGEWGELMALRRGIDYFDNSPTAVAQRRKRREELEARATLGERERPDQETVERVARDVEARMAAAEKLSETVIGRVAALTVTPVLTPITEPGWPDIPQEGRGVPPEDQETVERVRALLTRLRNYPDGIIALSETSILSGERLEEATRQHKAAIAEIDDVLATLNPSIGGEVEKLARRVEGSPARIYSRKDADDAYMQGRADAVAAMRGIQIKNVDLHIHALSTPEQEADRG